MLASLALTNPMQVAACERALELVHPGTCRLHARRFRRDVLQRACMLHQTCLAQAPPSNTCCIPPQTGQHSMKAQCTLLQLQPSPGPAGCSVRHESSQQTVRVQCPEQYRSPLPRALDRNQQEWLRSPKVPVHSITQQFGGVWHGASCSSCSRSTLTTRL